MKFELELKIEAIKNYLIKKYNKLLLLEVEVFVSSLHCYLECF